jgi:hypothetical protein
MKPLAFIVCTALAAAATFASAAEPAAPERDKALMLYFARPIGPSPGRSHSPFTYGLKLRQSSPFDFRRAMDLVDFRFSGARRPSLVLAGTLSFDSTGTSSEESSTASSNTAWSMKHKGMTITLVTLGLIGLACLAEVGLCESDDDDDYETSSPGPTGMR